MPLLDMSKPLDTENQVPRVRFIEIEAELAGQRVDNYLVRECRGVPKSHIYKAIRNGEVRVNKEGCQMTIAYKVVIFYVFLPCG